jgi:septal ring factor EnvC (AmiA/AmiB activator)
MKPRSSLEKFAYGVTGWIGSIQSVIIHTLIFVGSFFAVYFDLIMFDRMLLVLTTLVSLEAIYLSIFIQMSLNFTRESLAEVESDVDEIQEDIDEIQEDVSEIEKDVDEIQEDVGEIQEDIEEEHVVKKTP